MCGQPVVTVTYMCCCHKLWACLINAHNLQLDKYQSGRLGLQTHHSHLVVLGQLLLIAAQGVVRSSSCALQPYESCVVRPCGRLLI